MRERNVSINLKKILFLSIAIIFLLTGVVTACNSGMKTLKLRTYSGNPGYHFEDTKSKEKIELLKSCPKVIKKPETLVITGFIRGQKF